MIQKVRNPSQAYFQVDSILLIETIMLRSKIQIDPMSKEVMKEYGVLMVEGENPLMKMILQYMNLGIF